MSDQIRPRMAKGQAPTDGFWRGVSDAYDLDALTPVVPVEGGLSNCLWRADSGARPYAVKVMGVNADSPSFQGNVESAFQVEMNAYRHGVPCPEPVVSSDGRCLARVDGLWVRVHRWVHGSVVAPAEHAAGAARLLAAIHAASAHEDAELDDEPWDEEGWRSLGKASGVPSGLAADLLSATPQLAALEAATASAGARVLHVQSHGDLDPKNTLLVDGVLMALDWDAAGPQSAAREAVSVALDWTSSPEGFRAAIDAYTDAGGIRPPAEPWVLGGWVSANGGWLVYNVQNRAHTELGAGEAASALVRLIALHDRLPEYLAALR